VFHQTGIVLNAKDVVDALSRSSAKSRMAVETSTDEIFEFKTIIGVSDGGTLF
jgi:hypothetical protein